MYTVSEILRLLEKGKIDTNKAVNLIKTAPGSFPPVLL
jgi:hypothetical protein